MMPLLDDSRDPGSLTGPDLSQSAPGTELDIGPRRPANTADNLDPDEGDEDAEEDSDDMATDAREPKDAAGLRQFVYQPRKAAIKASIAIKKSKQLLPLVASPSPVKTRKRKAPEGDEKPPASEFRARGASGSASRDAKKPRLGARKGLESREGGGFGVAKSTKRPSGATGSLPAQSPPQHEPESAGHTSLIEGALEDDLEVDPPGSGTPFDALKWPRSLLEKVNRSSSFFPEGWADDEIKSIPDAIFVDIRQDLLAILRYDLLLHRPWKLLKQLPDSSPFWATWQKQEGLKIIHTFIAKVKTERGKDCANTLLDFARVATELAPSSSAVTRSCGLDAPTDFRVEGCQTCAKRAVGCDGSKPICKQCKQEGRTCAFGGPVTYGGASVGGRETYIRTGSLYDRQQEFADLDANNLLLAIRARIPPNREPSTLDYLALAGEVVESGVSRRVQGNLSRTTQDSKVDNSQAPMLTPTPK
jgi:hypothetical protein